MKGWQLFYEDGPYS